MTNSRFLALPRELRDQIYENLLKIDCTRTEKPIRYGTISAISSYDWNLQTAILRVNRQIHDEAVEMLAQNDFVVLETPDKDLDKTSEDYTVCDGVSTRYDVTLRPSILGKGLELPGERLRIWPQRKEEWDAEFYYVLLLEELPCFCLALWMLDRKRLIRNPDQRFYRHARIQIRLSPDSEAWRTEEKISRLLEPLWHFRCLENIMVKGIQTIAAPYLLQMIEYFLEQDVDPFFVSEIVKYFIHCGDRASAMGYNHVATTYYQRAANSLQQCKGYFNATIERFIIFRIMRRRAFNWIESDRFIEALEAASAAIGTAVSLCVQMNPNSPPGNGNDSDYSTSIAYRDWFREGIDLVPESDKHRLACEDVGRCYYYKAICERICYKPDEERFARESKLMSREFYRMHTTASEIDSIVRELKELEQRTLKRVRPDLLANEAG